MADLRAARRYASALFAVADREKALSEVGVGIRSMLDVWEANPRIAATMALPRLPPEAKERIWSELMGGGANDLLVRFARLLIEKRRIDLFPAAAAEFARLADERSGVVRAKVRSAVPLIASEVADLKKRLAGGSGATVELAQEVDPSLLGGVVVRIGDRVMDGSLKSQLEDLRHRLTG